MHVEIHDGSVWKPLTLWDSTTPRVPTWTKQEYDLRPYAGKSVRVRFRFDSVDAQFNTFAGWYVDDVMFSGITAVPQAPTAAFSGSPRVGSAPLTVRFTDDSLNEPTVWAWDFDNDGSVDSAARNPSHTFTAVGDHTVRLTVTNPLGSSSEVRTAYVTVTRPAHDRHDDVESGTNGWTASGLWHIATAPADCGVPALSGDAQWHFGDPGSCTYDTGSAVTGSLQSPEFVLGGDSPALGFFHQAETESFDSPFDRRIVEIDAGAGWVELVSWDSSDSGPSDWTPELVDLSAYSGLTVRIRFRFDSVDNLFNDFRGWNIDEVTVFNVVSP